MTSKTLGNLTDATALTGTEQVYVVQSSNSRKSTAQAIADLGTSQDNMTDGTTNKNYTATEQTKLAGIEAEADVTDAENVASVIHAATGKTTPVDADELPIIDSAASNVLKKVTYANFRSTIFAPGQIAFPGTQNSSSDANTLDDYEEASFTPSINFGGGSTGITYSTQTGRYTKIGNIILWGIRITLTSKGTSTGTLFITGSLPNVAGVNTSSLISTATNFSSVTSVIFGRSMPTSSGMNLRAMASDGSGAFYLSSTNLTDTTDLELSGWGFVAT